MDDLIEKITLIKDSLEKLKEVWNNEEFCKDISLNVESLKSLFKYNEELFEKNLELDKKLLDLEKELDIFKLAFYTLWKCCNSRDVADDGVKDTYIEFKIGHESCCVSASIEEIESIEKACEILDIYVRTEE